MKLDYSLFDTVIFDLDGTLVLTEHVWQAAKKEVAADYGVSVSDKTLDGHIGRRLVDFVSEQLFDPAAQKIEFERAVERIEELALGRLARDLTAVPGATRLVRDLSANNKLLAICSSAPLPAIHIALDVLKVRNLFSRIVSAASMPLGKPDPYPYKKTLELIKQRADRAIAVEDSLIGVTSAKRAGIFTVAVGGDAAVTQSGLPDIQFANLADILPA